MYNIINNSVDNEHLGQFEHICAKFIPYAKEKLGFDKPIDVEMISDPENAKDPFGKTAYYDPNMMKITLFVDKRHIKDILRSLSHELVHHAQNCRGDFKAGMHAGPGYAQKDPHLRKLEGEAYKMGNGFVFRDFEDQYKQLAENLDHFLNLFKDERKSDIYLLRQNTVKENVNMSTKIKISLKETLDLKHKGQTCAEAHDGSHAKWAQRQGIMLEDEELEDEELEDEELEEGGAAARTGNEGRDQGRERMAADRVHENEELEEEELEEEEVNENWTKGNKDQLLFERLMKKWVK